MKIIRILSICIITALLGSSCNDDLNLKEQTKETIRLVRIAASLDSEDSRIGLTESEESVELLWEKGDKLKVMNPSTNTIDVLTLKEGDGTAYGVFEGTISCDDNAKLYAFYHNNLQTSHIDSNGNVVIDMTNQDGKLNKDYQIMYGEVVYDENKTIQYVGLEHLTSMLKLTISTDKTLTNVTLNHEKIRSKATLVVGQSPTTNHGFKTGDLIYCQKENETENSTITISGTFKPVDGIVNVYIYTLPFKFYNDNPDDSWSEQPEVLPMFTVTSGDKTYVNSVVKEGKQMKRGKMYVFSSGLFEMEEFAGGNGSYERPYEIKTANQLYTFMMRTTQGIKVNDNLYNQGKHYKLGNDITLNNEIMWYPITLHNGSFDGQGHTISGSMEMHKLWQSGFFKEVNSSTIKNLTLDLNITFDTENQQTHFGTFVGSLNSQSKIINCINKSHISGSFNHMGGIVGYCLGSSIEACGNEGNLNSLAIDHCSTIGGIVGTNNTGGFEGSKLESSIILCYNIGTLETKVKTDFMRIGGIIGDMSSFEGDDLRNCWSKTTVILDDEMYDANSEYYEDIYVGALVGYQEGYWVYNCCWNFAGDKAIGGHPNNALQDKIEKFDVNNPTAEMIKALNEDLPAELEFMFSESDGKIVSRQSSDIETE